jgi:hypothetical protein
MRQEAPKMIRPVSFTAGSGFDTVAAAFALEEISPEALSGGGRSAQLIIESWSDKERMVISELSFCNRPTMLNRHRFGLQ